jgi:hypothetical protein
MVQTDISRLVQSFVVQIVSVVEQATTNRIQAALVGALPGAKRRGRPPKGPVLVDIGSITPLVARKKAPKQLCPVPGCKNAAAPVFGMVCAQHKDVPKAKIKEYRAKRKAAKAKKAA